MRTFHVTLTMRISADTAAALKLVMFPQAGGWFWEHEPGSHKSYLCGVWVRTDMQSYRVRRKQDVLHGIGGTEMLEISLVELSGAKAEKRRDSESVKGVCPEDEEWAVSARRERTLTMIAARVHRVRQNGPLLDCLEL
jgi:hypothetical protein